MERTGGTALLKDREQVADRLLEASAKHSYDPDTELDWDAELEPGKWFLPEHLVSLYGTPLWRQMGEEQRIELSRHEFASMASAGVWFEIILMQLLTRHIYDLDPRSSHVTYALTEMADECRHSRMFARAVTKLGTPYYGPGGVTRFLGRILKTTATTPGAFTATLLVEEILDRFQRLTFPDQSVQPLIQGITRIHVVEEARHVRYAREELRRQMATCPAWERQFTRTVSGEASVVVARALIHPGVYAAVGLDVEEARRQVRQSGHRQETMRWSAEKLTGFLQEIGIIHSALDRAAWRRSGLL
ncbi:diiron oxygenase [Streptacidiphilus sp. PB12-B1b]|uniref:AurF N-oxygenase family protein n=1 Tax=Streptacidiphilus sp. PB12-B1b TaxID=2705012 RepID=UPI0015FDB74B|nr:diiron oxygenase [Streptacidiphilus sp. PB12-B1b]QMU79174.1 diiron oxygenase [Streptacidiphilus sp. PB12-B1b]